MITHLEIANIDGLDVGPLHSSVVLSLDAVDRDDY